MTFQNLNYKLYVTAGKQYIQNLIGAVTPVTIQIYKWSDISLTNAIIDETLSDTTPYEIILSTDDRYRVLTMYGSTTDEYEYPYYSFFKTTVIEELQGFLCNCNPPMALNNCTDCEEFENTIDTFSFFTYMYSHLYLFTDQENMPNFSVFMNLALKKYETTLKKRYTDIFNHNIVRGSYNLDMKTLYIYYSVIYIFLYMGNLAEDTDSNYVNSLYDIESIQVCIEDLGLLYTDIVELYGETLELGRYLILEDLVGVSNICTDIILMFENLTKRKIDFETGLNVIIPTVPQHVFFTVPSSWGTVTEILDAANANLITDFTETVCGTYSVWQLNYVLPPDTYTFKFVY